MENCEWKAGHHLIIDFYNCSNHGTIKEIAEIMIKSCKEAGATVLFHHLHPFSGGGVSGAVILAESHMSIHSWPEYGYISLDLFVCGKADPIKALPTLQKHFEPQTLRVRLIERGSDNLGVQNIV